jgi:hypothetical protein
MVGVDFRVERGEDRRNYFRKACYISSTVWSTFSNGGWRREVFGRGTRLRTGEAWALLLAGTLFPVIPGGRQSKKRLVYATLVWFSLAPHGLGQWQSNARQRT